MIDYISCACNRVPHAADWGINGLICYAACKAVAIYDPEISKIGKVLHTLHQHKGRIISVQWIKSKNRIPETEILSSSVDGTAIIWSKLGDTYKPTYTFSADDIITVSKCLYLPNEKHEDLKKLVICSATISSDLKLWLRNKNGDVKCFQTLKFGRKLVIEVGMWYLNDQCLLLAIALDDCTIQLYCSTSTEVELNLVKVQTLVGHDDWIRCIDFTYDTAGNILLASASQDTMIRLWKISLYDETLAPEDLRQKEHLFEINNLKYAICLESVLSGHEGWVYGVHWNPVKQTDNTSHTIKLLSCSLDKSMIIWEPDLSTGIWSEVVRVGEVGGNSLGFYGCKFAPNGFNIMAHGYQGSFHIWQYSFSAKDWLPRAVPSGHFGEVVDICWDPKGRFLISASTDQTTRIHAPWEDDSKEAWHEIGRPQIHGYDMSCLAILKPYMFASGAEEKVIRIFTAPLNFKHYLSRIANIDDFEEVIAESANVPALGLTNKAVFSMENGNKQIQLNKEDYQAPTEEDLIQNTLWPELQKLYGHGYEIFSMAARHDSSLLATACKSTSPEHSAIIVWNIKTWSQVQKLVSHQLTVTQLSFSPNDRYLLSVSRDRRWSLFECKENLYTLVACSPKKDTLHSRIIWSCTWTHDSQYFATGSRDGKIGIWEENIKNTKDILPITSLNIPDHSVTALCFAPLKLSDSTYILATGYEVGCIEIFKVTLQSANYKWHKYKIFDCTQAHHLTVKRLAFRPFSVNNKLQLASCGSDHTVKIYTIYI